MLVILVDGGALILERLPVLLLRRRPMLYMLCSPQETGVGQRKALPVVAFL